MWGFLWVLLDLVAYYHFSLGLAVVQKHLTALGGVLIVERLVG